MAVIRPHDLLWGLTPAMLPADAPAWAASALADGQPVVVRRAPVAAGQVAVGVRGVSRDQRYGTCMPVAVVSRQVSPEALTHCVGEHDWPALQALYRLRPQLDACGLVWGVSGSAGFELASGFAALHHGSDLDLILHTPQPLSRAAARRLLDKLEPAVDMQLQTPAGAVALREWAGSSLKVLLKAAEGARLVSDPLECHLVSILLAFPGQGAQQPGMLHDLPDHPLVKACLDEASTALGDSVLGLDSAQALQHTRAVQLCLLVAGVASARLLLQDGPPADYVAGLSIGAYPAAVVAGALAFTDAVRLVALRGELMQAAYPQGYGMTAIVGLELARVEQLLAEAQGPVYLANINADNQVVIAGSDAAMAAVARQARAEGAGLAKPLAVSVPSHCALLAEPAQRLAEAFSTITLRPPSIRYLSGTTARPVLQPDRLRDDLAFNMCRVVDWRALARTAFERGVRLQIEMPPGSVLTGLSRRGFSEGTLIAWQGTRLDTLRALMQEEARRPQ